MITTKMSSQSQPVTHGSRSWSNVLECGSTIADTVSYYQEKLGWPVDAGTTGRQPSVTVGGWADAITMPAELGLLVLAELRIAMLAGPVVIGPGDGPVTFLTQPANTTRGMAPELAPLGVRMVPAGSRVVLPVQLSDPGRWSWLTPPAPDRELALWSAVMGAARRVAARLAAERS